MPCPESSIPDTLKWLSEREMEKERERETGTRHAKHFLLSVSESSSEICKICKFAGWENGIKEERQVLLVTRLVLEKKGE